MLSSLFLTELDSSLSRSLEGTNVKNFLDLLRILLGDVICYSWVTFEDESKEVLHVFHVGRNPLQVTVEWPIDRTTRFQNLKAPLLRQPAMLVL